MLGFLCIPKKTFMFWKIKTALYIKVKLKGKVHPMTGHKGPDRG
jgi:hypothetical protein